MLALDAFGMEWDLALDEFGTAHSWRLLTRTI
jgi:hypothetical protein